ncbi:MAG: NAD(P)/FAD-dependent oxidoreductase [Acidimicrobiia bacterium]
MRVVVIGAGMTGLTAARLLTGSGHQVSVLDKGRALGGRMATKRIGDARFDHGAQHFSARSPEFAETVDRLIADGAAKVWFESHSITEPDRGVEPRHVGSPSMRSVCEQLAQGLDVRVGVTVTGIRRQDGNVLVDTADGPLIADACVITAPLPQTLTLVGDLMGDHRSRFESIVYDPCLAAMLILDGPAGLPDGHLALAEGPIAWMADNQHKGVSPVPAVTVHASPEFSRQHLEQEPAEWLPVVVDAAAGHLGAKAVEAHGHRWRYSIPTNPGTEGAIEVAPGIVVAGEALAGARVEGAFLSGLAAAQRLC